MEDIRGNLVKVHDRINSAAQRAERSADEITLVAVSKTRTPEEINTAIDAGVTDIGENKVQEIMDKFDAIKPVRWHMIGHLQTNKVKYIAPYVGLVHSGDSPRLLAEINKQAQKAGRTIPCLLQLHVAQEETKFGFTPDEAMAYLDSGEWQSLTGVQLAGVMAMATNTDDTEVIRNDFSRARRFFETARNRYFANDEAFKELSMGMSDDWHIAIDEGSTLIRIGTQIFGQRQYT